MTPALRRYVAVEMTVAATISAVLSIGFALLLFGGRQTVPIHGTNGLIVDALPQSAAIAIMSSLVPTLLARRRLGLGVLSARAGRTWRPRHPLARAMATGFVVALTSVVAHRLLMPIGPDRWRLAAVLVYKPLYGMVLGAVVARWAVIAALADTMPACPGETVSAIGRHAERRSG